MRWLVRVAAGLFVAVCIGAGALWWATRQFEAPGPLAQPTNVVIPRGSGLEQIGALLEAAGVVRHSWLFIAGAALAGDRGLKAGEYAFPAGISAREAVELLRSGKTFVRRFTVPEGLTSAEIVALLNAEPALTGAIEKLPEEGTLLPETYHYSFGDSRVALLDRMRASFDKVLNELWNSRAPDTLLSDKRQAVILASIVEKETGVPAERPKVAGVFLNRLARGMRLQSDPTVVYALTQGANQLGRLLTRADLNTASPYNTYASDGLPPGPIANPGRASLEAVLRPESHDFLYFVADGTGGHAFARTLAEHNRNVANWRKMQQSAGQNSASPPKPGQEGKGERR